MTLGDGFDGRLPSSKLRRFVTMHDAARRSAFNGFAVPVLLTGAFLGLLAAAALDPHDRQLAQSFSIVCGLVAICVRLKHVSAPTTDLQPLLDRLDRIATALERERMTVAVAAAPVAVVGPPDDLGPIVLAIEESRWSDAEILLAERADHADVPRLTARLAEAKAASRVRLHDELNAARGVSDPVRVLELRDALTGLESPEVLKELDKGLVKWLMELLMRRMRAGTVRPDVAELAGMIAERFATTVEGASLRASLPTLRRSAGLCPKCARPYKGVEDACPTCMGLTVPTAPDELKESTEPDDDGPIPSWQDTPDLDELDTL